MAARDALMKQIEAQCMPETCLKRGYSLPMVSLEEFFTNNPDDRSIGRSLSEHPGVNGFYKQLQSIRSRPEVQDVLVEICEVDEANSATWPKAERIYFVT